MELRVGESVDRSKRSWGVTKVGRLIAEYSGCLYGWGLEAVPVKRVAEDLVSNHFISETPADLKGRFRASSCGSWECTGRMRVSKGAPLPTTIEAEKLC